MKESRMYFFVMRQLNGLNKGIQAGHAAVEYGLKYGNKKTYKNFAKHHKTFILLDGGGSEQMKTRMEELESFGIDYAPFYEPDLNNSLSAIAFILPEDIYGIDLNQAVEDYDDQYDHHYDIKAYISKFRLASN